MKSFPFSARNCFLLATILFSLQVIPHWWSDSVIVDEEWEITSSYYFWKTADVKGPPETSVFAALSALPLLGMDLKIDPSVYPNYENRSFSFLYLVNLGKLPVVTALSRAVTWVFGLLIGYLLYRLTRDAPPAERIAAMVFWAFEPNLLAFSGTAKAEIQAVFFFFLCLVYFSGLTPGSRPRAFLLLGFLVGVAVLARYSGSFLVPILLVLILLQGWGLRLPLPGVGGTAWRALSFLAGSGVALVLGFLPSTVLDPDHHSAFYFFIRNMKINYVMRGYFDQLPVFFAGHSWKGGSLLYFPYQFFWKNTLPFLVLMSLGVGLLFARRTVLPAWVWAPPAVYLGSYLALNKDMLVRHALFAYPFLLLIASRAFQKLWDACRAQPSPLLRTLPVMLLAWHPLSAMANFPHYLAYANDLMTDDQKPENLNRLDYSLDQDVKRLARTARESHWRKVKFASAGRADPYFYGMSWENWTLQDLRSPQPGTVYVVDPYLIEQYPAYQVVFQDPHSWIGRTVPTGNIGGTFNYYVFPGEHPADASPALNCFPYYKNGVPPYRYGERPPLQLEDLGRPSPARSR